MIKSQVIVVNWMDLVNQWIQDKNPVAHIEKKFDPWHLGEAARVTRNIIANACNGHEARSDNEMKRTTIGWIICTLITCFLATLAPAGAAEISIPAMEAEPGETLTVPVMVDQVGNLAGVKLVMTYDPKLLTFSRADKTRFTNSMMHIVNDKKPGTLIAVMAAARGIKGENFPILTMEFQVNKPAGEPADAAFEIREVQLMSDDLKDIPYTVKTPPIKILTAAPPETEPKAADPAGEGEGDETCGHE